jgi:hypothetical protein
MAALSLGEKMHLICGEESAMPLLRLDLVGFAIKASGFQVQNFRSLSARTTCLEAQVAGWVLAGR